MARRSTRIYWYLLAPALAYLITLTIFPTVFNCGISFFTYEFGRPISSAEFAGFANYIQIFSDPYYLNAVVITTEYTCLVVGAEACLGLLLAILLRDRFRGSGIIQSALLVPMMVPAVVAGLIWKALYNYTYGWVNYFLSLLLGLSFNWLGSSDALYSLVIVDIWQWLPFMMLIFLAGLRSLPSEPHEAALVDGASTWQRYRYVTIPLLRRVILIAVILRLIDALKSFDLVYTMTKGGPGTSTEVYSFYVYKTAITFYHMGTGAAMALIFSFAAIAIASALLRFLYPQASGVTR